MLRHAQTDPGIGDPPGFSLEQCSTQRNLSQAGRLQAKRIGQWFEAQGLRPGAVKSSAWCRCKDTADLAFGRHSVWPALNSFFESPTASDNQTEDLRSALVRIPGRKFEVWVTHQVNMTALTGESIMMGEAVILDSSGKIFARMNFD
ncbi:MAG: Phosphoglycerate mutase [Polaromonas sp.]|nr:Phosphoglycerate mutase [Polaromonas sp.]